MTFKATFDRMFGMHKKKLSYQVKSYEGLGPVQLGMARAEVRTLLREKPGEVPRSRLPYPMDFFVDAALQVEYGKGARVVAIQATGRTGVRFKRNDLMGKPFADVRRLLESMDAALIVDGAGLVSRVLGIAIYAESAMKHPDLPVEAVMVFVPDYYEKGRSRTL